MKTNRIIGPAVAAAGLVALFTAGCAEKATVSATSLPSSKEMASASAAAPTTASSGATAAPSAAADATATWGEIKDHNYEARVPFFAGLKRLEARVDRQVGELEAQRAAMTGATDTKNWDFAMKEMGNARSYLKSTGAELGNATPETWEQQKAKVGQAWERAQNAYTEVKSSTTG